MFRAASRRACTSIGRQYGHKLRAARHAHMDASPTSSPAPSPSPRPRNGRRIAAILVVSVVAGASLRVINGESKGSSTDGLNQSTFTPFTLVKKEAVSPTSSIFTLRPDRSSDIDLDEYWTQGVWSVAIKQPQLQIARAYTPLPPTPSFTANDELRLLIRKEDNGELSNYIHRLPAASTVELRGPTLEYGLPKNVREIIFLAGGTGIAPASQIAHALSRQSKVTILWANRKREDCLGGVSGTKQDNPGWFSRASPPAQALPSRDAVEPFGSDSKSMSKIVQQLDHLKRMGDLEDHATFTVDYFVDEEKTFIQSSNVTRLLEKSAVGSSTSIPGSRLIIVSGPEGFVKHWAGPKEWRNGREVQGSLGGVLGQLDLEDWTVVKL